MHIGVVKNIIVIFGKHRLEKLVKYIENGCIAIYDFIV